MDAADDPETREITIMGGTQIGKTTLLEALLIALAERYPAPMMLAAPDRKMIKTLQNRVYGHCDEMPVFRHRLPTESKRNLDELKIGGSLVYLGWSGSVQSLSGRACRVVLCTEIDRWKRSLREGSAAAKVAERVKAFKRSLIVREGTPTDLASEISSFYEHSDQRKFLVPCPFCGHRQELRFFPHKSGPYAGCGGIVGIEDAEGNLLDADDAHRQAYYKCERGCKIRTRLKAAMVRRGQWVKAGQRLDRKGRLRGKPKRSGRVAGFHISSLYSLSLSWGDIAAKYITMLADGQLQEFFNDWLGLKFGRGAKVPRWQDLGARIEGHHDKGTVPAGALFLTSGVDVQGDCLYWVVRAWGEHGTSWLVDWGRIAPELGISGEPELSSDLAKLDATILDREWPIAGGPNPVGQTSLAVRLLCIDVNYRTREVHNWARRHVGDRIRLVAGSANAMAPNFNLSVIEKGARDGKAYPGGLHRWELNTATYKGDLLAKWSYKQGAPGFWWCHRGAVESAAPYLRQVVNESPHYERDKRGRKVKIFKVIDNRTGNHYLDCEGYALAASDMIVGPDWSGVLAMAQAGVAASKPAPPPEPARDDREVAPSRRLNLRRREGYR